VPAPYTRRSDFRKTPTNPLQTMITEQAIKVSRHDGWATVSLNRPQRKNAMTGPMMDQLAEAMDALSADEGIAAIVLRGEQGSFSSGVDLTELQAQPQHPWVPTFVESVRRAHISLYRCACPIIVGLERYSINGSTALALAGDLIVAGQGAFMQIGEIQQGARIPMNAAWLRIKLGEHVLARMAYQGDRVPAPELLRLGVVTEVVEDAGVLARCEALASRMAGFSARHARQIKIDVRAQSTVNPETWFATTASPALLAAAQVRR